MNPGKLDERVKLMRLNEGTSDGQGGFINSGWVTVMDTWAHVQQDHGGRYSVSGKTAHTKPYIVTMMSRRPNAPGDYDPNENSPGDYDTAVALNELSERFGIMYRGRFIVFHSVIEEGKKVNKILGYSKKVTWQPASS